MSERDPELVAKLHCLNALLADKTGRDPFFTDTIREAIELAITGNRNGKASLPAFAKMAFELSEQVNEAPPSFGFELIDLKGGSFDPLWVREELVSALKRLAGYRHTVLVVSGLEKACRNGSLRRTFKVRRRCTEARRYIEAVAAQYTAAGACATIYFFD